MYDVIIIGAGVSGAAVARELSRYRLKICVLEREEDVCCGTSKANSGIAHSGYDAEPGSLMAELIVLVCFLDYIYRPMFYFSVGFGQIFSHDADAKKLQPTDQENNANHAWPSCNRIAKE